MSTRKLFNYERSNIYEALKDIQNGMSVKAATKKHGVPRTTLTRHKANPQQIIRRKPAFSKEEENSLAQKVIELSRAGFPLTKDQFLNHVKKRVDTLEIPLKVSRNWYAGFLRRQPKLSLRSYQNLTKSRASVNYTQIHGWFTEVENYLKNVGQFHILNNPRRVFNADESAFYLNPKSGKVLAERGCQFMYQANSNDEKENVTVLLNGNAHGEFAPPMAVFRYKRMPDALVASIPENWTIGKSENGGMTQETMFVYVCNFFHPWLVEMGIELPIIFFVDGHVSHMSLELADFCAENGIILVGLYPNATHLLQPMDVAIFKGMKVQWKKKVQEWRISNDFREMKKHELCPLLEKALQDFNKESLSNGFQKCGLVPWNRHAIEIPLVTEQEPVQQKIPTAVSTEKYFLKMLEVKG